MDSKQKYFAEYEFFSKDGDVYWFPALISSDSLVEAKELNKEIEKLLQTKYDLKKKYGVLKYSEPMYSAALRPYVEERKRAEIFKLNLQHLRMSDFEKGYTMSFKQHIVMVPNNLILFYKHLVQFNFEKSSFLTAQFSKPLNYDQEFLVLKFY